MAYNRAILRELVTACFDAGELNVFCSDHFAEVYNNFTDGQDKSDRVLKLLDHVERRSNFKQLAELVKGVNPGKFKEFEARLAEEAEQNTDPEITDALRLIQEELKRNPDYASLKTRFEEILKRISKLSDYKALHDGLHEIQYSYLENILASTKIVMDDKYARLDLTKYMRDYRRVVTDMRAAADHKEVDEPESLWISQLDQAGIDLEEGVKKGNQAQVSSATQTMNQVIGTQPTIINRKLYQAVYAYNENLPVPTVLMNNVWEKIKAIAPDAEKVKHFQKGIDLLKEINSNLKELIAEHNSWQDVEGQLRMLGGLLADAGIIVFNKVWLGLRAQIERYYSNKTDESSVRLKDADDLVAAAITSNDPENVRKAFENYYSEASDRFFYIDKSVLELCERLTVIRNDLD